MAVTLVDELYKFKECNNEKNSFKTPNSDRLC